MARPIKTGIDYFSLDTKFDDEVVLIMAKYGAEGLGILITLWQLIYNNGYYLSWTEKELLLYNNRFYADSNRVNDVVNECLKWGIFEEKLFKKYSILTSCGIQKRFMAATERRTEFTVDKQFWLIKEVNANINVVNADNNSINTNISTQSKVNRKEIEKKEKYTEEFELIYSIYPRSENKQQTFKNYCNLRNRYSSTELSISVNNYLLECKRNKIEKSFMKNSSNFFGKAEYYHDYLSENYEKTVPKKPVEKEIPIYMRDFVPEED